MFLALRAKEINTRVELSRALWNSHSALVSIRILPDLVSSSPFPSPLPYFLSSNRQNEIWGRDQDNCSEIVLKIVLVSIMSIILILLALCGTVLIFFSAHSVFITAERSVMKRHMHIS